jgi:hypothetical protein
MAALPPSRRSAAGFAFLAAGALVLLGILAGLSGVALGPWPHALAWLAVGVGFVILAVSVTANTAARVGFSLGAAGWFLLGLAEAGSGLLPVPIPVVAGAAAIGGVIGAVMLRVGKEITDVAGIVFIVTLVVAAVLIGGLFVGPPIEYGMVLTITFAAGLVVTGYLFLRVLRRRRSEA